MSTQASGDGRGYLRGANIVMKTPAPTTVALPAPWSIESPTLESTALRRATLTLPAVLARRLVRYARLVRMRRLGWKTRLDGHTPDTPPGRSWSASHRAGAA